MEARGRVPYPGERVECAVEGPDPICRLIDPQKLEVAYPVIKQAVEVV